MGEEIMKQIEELLEKMSGKDVSSIKMHKCPIDEMVYSYMNIPLVTLECTRLGTNIKTSGPYEDIKNVSIHCIGTILNLFPKDERNSILYEAIQIPKSDEGELFEDEEDDEEE